MDKRWNSSDIWAVSHRKTDTVRTFKVGLRSQKRLLWTKRDGAYSPAPAARTGPHLHKRLLLIFTAKNPI